VFTKYQVADPSLDYGNTNRIDFEFAPGTKLNTLHDEFVIACNL
jgi:hypothetical protein